jgi:integrase
MADLLRSFQRTTFSWSGGVVTPAWNSSSNNRDIVDQVLHPILARLGIARAGLHAFRHGNATIMDGLNAPMRVRQGRLGHEKAETTLGYTDAIGEDERRVADEIGNILCSSLPKSSEVKVGKQVPAQ